MFKIFMVHGMHTRCMECITRCMECITRCMECITRCMECITRCMECTTRCMECITRCMECTTPHRQDVGCVLRTKLRCINYSTIRPHRRIWCVLRTNCTYQILSTNLRCMECTLPGDGGQHVPGQGHRQLETILRVQGKQPLPYRIAVPMGAGLPQNLGRVAVYQLQGQGNLGIGKLA